MINGGVCGAIWCVQNFTTTNPHHKYILPPEPGGNFTVFLGKSPLKTPDRLGPESVDVQSATCTYVYHAAFWAQDGTGQRKGSSATRNAGGSFGCESFQPASLDSTGFALDLPPAEGSFQWRPFLRPFLRSAEDEEQSDECLGGIQSALNRVDGRGRWAR